MHLINLIVNYLYRKYGVPLHIFFENWSRGTSYLKFILILMHFVVGSLTLSIVNKLSMPLSFP